MPDRRDSMDDLVDAAIGWFLGFIFVLLVSAGQGWQYRQERKQRVFKLPPALRINYSHPAYRWTVWRSLLPNFSGCLLLLTGCLTIILTCGGFIGVVNASSSAELGNTVMRTAAGFAGIISGIVSGCAYLWLRNAQSSTHLRLQGGLILTPLKWNMLRIYTIRLPKNTAWRAEAAGRFMQQMLQKLSSAAFQIVAENGGIYWRIVDFDGNIETGVVRQAIIAFYPDAEVMVSGVPAVTFEHTFYRFTQTFQQSLDFIMPIQYVDALAKFDPLVPLASEMCHLRPGERITYTLVVTEPAQFVYDQAERVLTIKPPPNPFDMASWSAAVYKKAAGINNRVPIYNRHDFEVIVTKLRNLVYQAVLFFQIDAPTPERVHELSYLISHISQFDHPEYNMLLPSNRQIQQSIQPVNNIKQAAYTSPLGLLAAWLTNGKTDWQQFRLVLDTRELAALWHLPHEHFNLPDVVWTRGRNLPVPAGMRGKREGVCIGLNRRGDQVEEVYIPDEDQATHISIIGQTGMGKSTLLHRLIDADIAQGRGVAVIDPKGHLVRDVLRFSIREGRESDVVVLDIANLTHPPPFNLLAAPQNVEHGSAVGLLLAVFERVYRDFGGTRMADTFSMAIQTLWEADTPTVMDVERLFEDADFRHTLAEKSDSFVVRNFWRHFEARSSAQQDELAYPVIHRMRAFYGNRYLYPIMCHPQPLNIHRLISERRIILVSLNAAEANIPRSEQNLLGAIFITQIQMAAMGGAIRRPPFTLYVDESQHFATTSLPQMLEGARGWGLSVVMANQHLKQLSGDTLDAVVGNVGITIAFQCGEPDARHVARLRPGFSYEDLMQLDRYNAGVFMRYKGETQPAFRLETQPPPTNLLGPEITRIRESYLRLKSIDNYTPWKRQQVDDWLNRRYPAPQSGSARQDPDADFYDPVN